MKKLLALLTILLLTLKLSYSQEYTGKPLYYSEVIEIDSVSQEELKTRARIWFAETHIYSQDILNVEENEQIIGQGVYEYYGFRINFTIKLYFKDDKYKYVINDFTHIHTFFDGGYGLLIDTDKNPEAKPKGLLSDRNWDNRYKYIIDNTKHDSYELIKSLKKSMRLNQQDINDW